MAKKTAAQGFRDIFNRWTLGSTPAERAEGEKAADKWLKRHKKTRIDIPVILAQAAADDAAQAPQAPPSDPRDAGPAPPRSRVTVLDLIRAMAEDYFIFENPHEYVAFTLWVAHTHVYDFYQITPRLVITSATEGCGKSIPLKVIDRLAARSKKSDYWTVAALRNAADDRRTIGVDEADNLPFDSTKELRSIFNSGYDRTGAWDISKHTFRTFAPLALAAIGVLTSGLLPPALLRRSIIILMRKHRERMKRRYVKGNTPELDEIYKHLRLWGDTVTLNHDPELPDALVGADPSIVDNWRVLISVADGCSRAWGDLARAAAVFFARAGRSDNPVVMLLHDIRTIFDTRGIDRIVRDDLLKALHEFEDDRWSEYQGTKKQLHKLTVSELYAMLRPIGVIVHPIGIGQGTKAKRGYYRSDFEAAWKAYCDDESAKPKNVLRFPVDRT